MYHATEDRDVRLRLRRVPCESCVALGEDLSKDRCRPCVALSGTNNAIQVTPGPPVSTPMTYQLRRTVFH